MKNLKNFFGFVVAFSMTLSLSGVVSTPILAVEENTDQVTEDQIVTETPTEEKKDEADTGEAPVTDEIQGEVVTEQPTTPESDNTEELAETDVARNLTTGATYELLDTAVEEATEGDTIELLKDADLTKGFNKTLTFTGNGKITTNKQLTSNGEGWMCFGLYDSSRELTLDGAGLTWEWKSEVGTAPWLMLSLSGKLNITNGATLSMTVDSGSTGSRNAIYMNAGSEINVTNGGHFNIFGYSTDGKEGQGLQLDKTGQAKVNVTGGSTFLIDGTNRGYVNSPEIYVDNSQFTVQNCTANASNGGVFTATNHAVVKYLNNAGHGLSASSVKLSNYTNFESDNNGYYGVYASADLQVDGTSTLKVTRNSYSGDFAGLKLTSGVTDGHVQDGAVVTITNNYCSGLSNNGNIKFDDNVNLTIVDNVNDKGKTSNGGGIYNSGNAANLILPQNALIYNNSAKTAGDDIYNGNGAKLQISQPSIGNILTRDGDDTNEDQAITNWFYDGANPSYSGKMKNGETARWNQYKYVKTFTMPEAGENVTGNIGLKAAYAPVTTFTPIDLTMYVGGEEYENVDKVEDNDTSNGFPEPGYYVTLPKEINDAIQSNGQPVDLSEETNNFSFEYTYNYNNGEELRHWKMTKYTDADGSESTKDGNYVYSLALADGRKPTLRVIDDAGNIQTNANFDLTNAVNKVYTTMVGSVEGDSFTSGEINESKSLTANVQTDTIDVDFDRTVIATGKLYVRGVVNVTDENLITSIQEDGTDPKAGVPMATVPEGTTFYINGEEGLEVQKNADPSLLYDDILPEGTDANNDRRIGWLTEKAEQLCNQYGLLEQAGITNPQYSFKYMDIVDQNNGNVVLKADKNVTVYMPYPEGVDKDTSIIVLHYKDLNRDMTYDDVQSAIMNCEMEKMTVTQLDDHIEFETTSFSPFVVIWGTDEAGEIVKNKDRADTGLFQNAPLYIALMTACASLVAIIAIKRRIDAK